MSFIWSIYKFFRVCGFWLVPSLFAFNKIQHGFPQCHVRKNFVTADVVPWFTDSCLLIAQHTCLSNAFVKALCWSFRIHWIRNIERKWCAIVYSFLTDLIKLNKLINFSRRMFTLLSGLWKYLFQKDEYCILILGLDNAGKSVRFQRDLHVVYKRLIFTSQLFIGPTTCMSVKHNFGVFLDSIGTD